MMAPVAVLALSVITLGLTAYLTVVILYPEKF